MSTSAGGTPVRRDRRRRRDEEGSILLLTIGYALLALAVILVCANATSLYLAQKQLDGLADSAALAAADGFTIDGAGDDARARLDGRSLREQAQAIIDVVGGDASLVAAGTPDGVSARVTVADVWHPPVISLFVPDGVTLEATATSRTALV